ncbi:hypothetical protein TELCIR_06819 [Teladorsagia circumcincta]|uniref:Methyltransferase type 11 domain-containing protein n=1 Tax=Teladorsagia circumcincta TaxID=45464 RepID=A0A2G9UM16_TELCI|nr:hypothetical protein TELCIR_06819 [Teladorsagia circumcincta]
MFELRLFTSAEVMTALAEVVKFDEKATMQNHNAAAPIIVTMESQETRGVEFSGIQERNSILVTTENRKILIENYRRVSENEHKCVLGINRDKYKFDTISLNREGLVGLGSPRMCSVLLQKDKYIDSYIGMITPDVREMSSALENEYVHTAYSRLATYQKKDHRPSSPRIWPNVRKFLESQASGSTVIDVGCGEAKYTCSSVLVLGVDTCADALIGRTQRSHDCLDLLLADALTLPFRNNTADAVLNVSVLHHLSTATRRKAALEGRLPRVKFHKDSTKEQRVIQDSIPIAVHENEPSPCSKNWFGSLFNKIPSIRPLFTFVKPDDATTRTPPPAAPKFLPNAKQSLITGRRLATLLISVEEQLADEITQKILHEALTETMASLREFSKKPGQWWKAY